MSKIKESIFYISLIVAFSTVLAMLAFIGLGVYSQ